MASIIVSVYKNNLLAEYCLDAVTRNLPRNSELIVVDDNSGGTTADIIKQFNPSRLLTHEETRGNTVSYNTGAKAASSEILIFMNSDVLVEGDALALIEETFHSTSTPVGVVGSLLCYPSNRTVQHAGVALDRWVLSHVFKGAKPSDLSFEPIEERQALTGALFACRKKDFDALGGFDEIYRDGLEDIDFCLRIRAAGMINLLRTDVRATHFESAVRGPYKAIRRTYNYVLFFSRWHGRFKPDLADFLRRRLEALAQGNEPIPCLTTCVNFCTTPNWQDLMVTVLSGQSAPYEIHDLSGFIPENGAIDLHTSLPLTFQRTPSSLLFILDHFSQLAGNTYWFDNRPTADLIIDRHANVLPSRSLRFS